MIKSTTKEAKKNIRNYIDKIYSGVETDDGIIRYSDFKDQAKHIDDVFKIEYYFGYNARRNKQDMFFAWCSGLCGIIDTADYFCENSAVDVVGDILKQTEQEKSKFSEYDAEKYLTYLIYREIQSVL